MSGGQARFFVYERLQIVEQVAQRIWWWGHERGGLDGRAGSSDPILRDAKLAWLTISAANPVQNEGMQFANESGAQRKRVESTKTGLDRSDVVDDFFDIGSEG